VIFNRTPVHTDSAESEVEITLKVSVQEAETHFTKLLITAMGGQEIIITNAGRPIARLVPMTQGRVRRVQGSAKGRVAGDSDSRLPENILAEFES